MTCKEAIEQLHEFLDNELGDANYTKIRQHINMCHECCEKFEFEQALKKVIREKNPDPRSTSTCTAKHCKSVGRVE